MKKHLVFAVLPFLALGCGDDLKDENGDGIADGIQDPDSVTVVTPANPKGTVSGQVLATGLSALTDVTVALTIGSGAETRTTTTDAAGNFKFGDVPGGAQVLLTFSKTGYATLRASSTVPTSAGNVPINNGNASFGPITLARTDGTMRFLLVTPQGKPAAGFKATLEASPGGTIMLSNNSSFTVSTVSDVVVEATADDSGMVQFTGIPNATELARLNGAYRLWVPATDTSGDGVPETGGYVDSYAGSTVVSANTPRIINLPYARLSSGNLAVEASNIGYFRPTPESDPLRNMVKPGEPIYLYFNQPVQSTSLLVLLTDEYAKELLPVSATLGNGGYTAIITPGGGVQDGREYNIDVRAVSAEGGTNFARTGFFFGGDTAAGQKTLAIAEARYQENSLPPLATAQQLNTNELVYINFNYPLARTFATTAAVQVFINANIGDTGSSTNIVGDVQGELGNPRGFDLVPAEPTQPYVTKTPAETPVFAINPSGYTTRYVFTYGGNFALSPNNTSLVVAFSKLASQSNGSTNLTYESIWGQPAMLDLSVTGIAQQPLAP